MTDTYDVFLSYARADDSKNYDDPTISFMRRLYLALTQEGFKVWWDREALGKIPIKFGEEIEAGIRASAHFVLIAGPGAKASPWVRQEWGFALKECKPITVILRAGEYSDVPEELKERNAIDIRPERDEAAALRDLVNRLRTQVAPGNPLGLRKQIPPEYIVREEAFTEAREALCADAISKTVISSPPRAVAVYGLGGIGKSTLATALVSDCQVRSHFPDGLLWIEVGRKPTIPELQAAVGVYLGDSRDRYQNPQEALINLSSTLQQKTALIVLDDVWDHKVVEDFPINGTACRLLITTRSGQLARRVQGADIRLQTLNPEEGAALIQKITGTDAPQNRTIAERFDGHTLAISLAAKQIAEGFAEDAAEMLRLIDKRREQPQPFRDLTLEEEDKDLNLALSLSISYDALKKEDEEDNDLRRRFRQTGILPIEATFDLEMLAALWGDEDADDTRMPLKKLVEAGLLDAVEGSPRYTQHGLLRAYARALLSADERETAFRRYAEHVTEQARQFDTLKPEDWGALDPLLPHVDFVGDALTSLWDEHVGAQRAAPLPTDTVGARPVVPDTADTNDTPKNAENDALTTLASNFAYNVTNYVFRRPQAVQTADGTRLRGMNWLEMGLAASRAQGNKKRAGLFLNQIALAYSSMGEKQLALEYYEQKLPIDRELEDQSGEATTLNNIGAVYRSLGEPHKALDYYQQALEIIRQIGDRKNEATTLNNIGRVYRSLGEPHKALDFYQQALPLRRAVGDRSGEATTLNNIGAVYRSLGEPHKALDFYQQALPILRDVGNRSVEAATLNNIGGVWDALGEKHKALDFYQQALALRRAVGDRSGEATTLNNIGAVWSALGEGRKAIEYFEQALPLMRAVGDRSGEATTLNNIGSVWDALGEKHKALAFYQQALPLRRAVGDRSGEAATLNNIGSVWSALGEKHKALDFYQQALPLRRAVGDRSGEATTLNNIGMVWSALGEKHKALDYYQQALPLMHVVGDRSGEAVTCYNMGMVYRALGDLDQAIAYVARCVELDEQVLHPDLESDRRTLEQLKRERDAGE